MLTFEIGLHCARLRPCAGEHPPRQGPFPTCAGVPCGLPCQHMAWQDFPKGASVSGVCLALQPGSCSGMWRKHCRVLWPPRSAQQLLPRSPDEQRLPGEAHLGHDCPRFSEPRRCPSAAGAEPADLPGQLRCPVLLLHARAPATGGWTPHHEKSRELLLVPLLIGTSSLTCRVHPR